MYRNLALLVIFLAGLGVGAALPDDTNVIPVAHAADRADDYILHIDINSTNGGIKRTLELAAHVPLDTSQWAAERAEAAKGLSDWLTWMQTNNVANYNFISGLSAARQEGLRQALIKGA